MVLPSQDFACPTPARFDAVASAASRARRLDECGAGGGHRNLQFQSPRLVFPFVKTLQKKLNRASMPSRKYPILPPRHTFAALNYAEGGHRTLMMLPPQDFESCASANSATSAYIISPQCTAKSCSQQFEFALNVCVVE